MFFEGGSVMCCALETFLSGMETVARTAPARSGGAALETFLSGMETRVWSPWPCPQADLETFLSGMETSIMMKNGNLCKTLKPSLDSVVTRG